MIPNNLPTLLGISSRLDDALEEALAASSLEDQLIAASRAAKLRIHLSKPVRIWSSRRLSEKKTTHVVSRLFKSGSFLCVARRKARSGYSLPEDFIADITRWEAIPDQTFTSFQQFRRRFDTRFITDAEIHRLYSGLSSQHGGKYHPSDFRKLGPRGRGVMERFLKKFKDVNSKTPFYMNRDGYSILRESYDSRHHAGRDITISHQSNHEWLYFATEYHHCGNGRYGLIANEKTFLWLEDD